MLGLDMEANSFDPIKYRKELTQERVRLIDTGEQDYVVFWDEKERADIVKIGEAICNYIFENEINDVVFVDRSMRAGYVAVIETWKRLHPDKKMPNIFFVNPKGFISREDMNDNPSTMRAMLKNSLDTDNASADLVEGEDNIRREQDIMVELKEKYKKLFGSRKKVLLMDACYHSGDTVKPVENAFARLGAEVKLGVVASSNTYSKGAVDREFDLEIFSYMPQHMCHPFDYDLIVQKTYKSVASVSNEDQDQRKISRQIRKEIKRLIGEAYR